MSCDIRLKRIAIIWIAGALAALVMLISVSMALAEVSALESIAASEGVPVYYVGADAITEYTGKCANGFYDIDNNFIAVDSAMKLDAKILAHELGHYYAIRLYGDKSEDAADRIGAWLLRKGRPYDGGM